MDIKEILKETKHLNKDDAQKLINSLVFQKSCTPMLSLRELIDGHTFYIPKYQRGYVWEGTPKDSKFKNSDMPLDLFWKDLLRTQNSKDSHYMGMIALRWNNTAKAYEVVDGQQRLTTCAILLKQINKDSKTKEKISLKFEDQELENIFEKNQDDNADQSVTEDNIYQKRLNDAKKFFIEKLEGEDKNEIKKTLLDKLRFNILFANEMQSSIIFETINNRGKGLTKLEILKNRVYYLLSQIKNSNGINASQGKISLRWKNIFENLGVAMASKNIDTKTVTDDEFLRAWGFLEFADMSNILKLDENQQLNFILNQFEMSQAENFNCKQLLDTMERLQNFSIAWRSFFTQEQETFFAKNTINEKTFLRLGDQTKIYLDKIARLAYADIYIRSCVVGIYYSVKTCCSLFIGKDVSSCEKLVKKFVEFLKFFEKYLFCLNFMRPSNTKETSFLVSFAKEIYGFWGSNKKENRQPDIMQYISEFETQIETLKTKIIGHKGDEKKDCLANLLDEDNLTIWKDKINAKPDHFFGWSGINYFLYELEEKLKGSNTERFVEWSSFKPRKSIEHIFPQHPKNYKYWKDMFDLKKDEPQPQIAHSLGNLIPLKLDLNQKLQNFIYPVKKIAYENSSYMARKVADDFANWNIDAFKERTETMFEQLKDNWLTFDKVTINGKVWTGVDDVFWNNMVDDFISSAVGGRSAKKRSVNVSEEIAKHLLDYCKNNLNFRGGKNKNWFITICEYNSKDISAFCAETQTSEITNNMEKLQEELDGHITECEKFRDNLIKKEKLAPTQIKSAIAVFPKNSFGKGGSVDVDIIEQVLLQMTRQNAPSQKIYLYLDFTRDTATKKALNKKGYFEVFLSQEL